jgi:hypothetical protein
MPAPGVSVGTGRAQPVICPIHNPHTGVLPAFEGRAAWTCRRFSCGCPRGCRCAWTPVPARANGCTSTSSGPCRRRPPYGPYAVYLSSVFGGYRWLGFDLDRQAWRRRPRSRNSAALVGGGRADLRGRRLRVRRRTARVGDRRDAAEVDAGRGSIAVAAAKRLPTLDYGLLKSTTGAVRPIGAPHRNGRRSELMSPPNPAAPPTCSPPPPVATRPTRSSGCSSSSTPSRPARTSAPRWSPRTRSPRSSTTTLAPGSTAPPTQCWTTPPYALLTRRPPPTRSARSARRS